ncbi:threonine/serine exporter family protein [Rothia kristinae]|uniref:Threonine/serine exporter family protein n=1 Tax=Rothia kristinae TaxID=37923 RepID=A0A7T3CHY3_9MICC|nr:threonine/serine exporter family protein [Rothia kristinae]QPT54506.1 threonine/serine exporter family protein [Rothia kristinae]
MNADPEQESREERLGVVGQAAQLMLTHGSTTSGTVQAVEDLSRRLEVPVRLLPEWDGSVLASPDGRLHRRLIGSPTGVHMGVVVNAMAQLRAQPKPSARELSRRLEDAASTPAYPLPIFALACITGACSLAAIFGARLPVSYVLVAVAAGLGAVIRRWLGGRGVGPIGQAFAAALLAGLAGALTVHLGTASDARLVAVCPAMVLVPGPHLLNGMLDLAARRITLGWARLVFGTLIVVGISIGLLLGLALGGAQLPVHAAGRSVAWWIDVPAAAAAAASYPVYFSLQARYIPHAVLAGAAAHAVRWVLLGPVGAGVVVGDFIACLVAGLVVAPVVLTRHVPFAGIGFAAVVALVPGVFVFRTVAGLMDLVTGPSQDLLLSVTTDAATAALSLAAMTLGLLTAHGLAVRLRPRRLRARP